MGILASLMSKNKDKQQQKSMPPFNSKPNTTTYEQYSQPSVEKKGNLSKPKTLEDFAKEVYDQLNEKTIQPKDIYNEQKYNEVTTETKVPKHSMPVTQLETGKVRDSRPTLDNNRSTKQTVKHVNQDVIKQSEIGSYVPKTKQALIQAIVASEIIGPPKAKQR